MKKYRDQLDKIDEKMLALFVERLDIISNIAKVKKAGEIAIIDEKREQFIIEKGLLKVENPIYKKHYKKFIETQLKISKELQSDLIKGLLKEEV